MRCTTLGVVLNRRYVIMRIIMLASAARLSYKGLNSAAKDLCSGTSLLASVELEAGRPEAEFERPTQPKHIWRLDYSSGTFRSPQQKTICRITSHRQAG